MDFVRATIETGGAKFVPPEERIATFDQDGTLWVEHPIYSQVMYCLHRVPVLVKEKPELKNVEPFKTVLFGDLEAIAKLPLPELLKIVAATRGFTELLSAFNRNLGEFGGDRVCIHLVSPCNRRRVHRVRQAGLWPKRADREGGR